MPAGVNPYDVEELKRQAQMNALTPGKSLTSDEYFALNQANAKANPIAQPIRPTMDEFKAKNTEKYGYDGTYEGGNAYQAKKNKRDILTKAVLPAAIFATGGAASAGLLGGSAATAPAFATEGIGFSAAPAVGGSSAAAGASAASASKIPWGKLLSTGAQAVSALGESGGGSPESSQGAQTTTTPPTVAPPVSTTTTPPVTTPTVKPASKTVAPVNTPPPPGWDAKNWADPNMHTVKYDAGRLLNGVTKPSEVARIVASPEFQARFPGATFDGKDKVDFKGALSEGSSGSPVGRIDVLMAADQGADSSNGLWWGYEPDAAESGGASGGLSAALGSLSQGLSPAADNSTLAKIMAELQAASDGAQSPTERDAILALL